MTARITLAALVVVAAALAYPWQTTVDWWVLGVAAAVLVVVFAWWRGLFATTMLRRRVAVWRRNHGKRHARKAGPQAAHTTVTLRLDGNEVSDEVPLPLIVGYVERYGIRARKVRVTSHDAGGARTTWVSLTVSAADNLAALRARAATLPLRETAEVAGRRLTDHLREAGWTVTPVERADTPLPAGGTETWRGVRDDAGFVAAYRIAVDDRLAERLAAVSALSPDTWTAVEFTGTSARPELTVGCAVRTPERPATGAPAPGLTPQRGRHRPALEAIDPVSDERLEGAATPLPAGLLDRLEWPATARRGHEAPAVQASM